MRVVHVINTAQPGGGAEHLLQLTRHLPDRGFESSVLVGCDGPTTARLREAGIEVGVLGPLGASAPFRIASRLQRARPGLVHLHGSRAGLAGTLAARACGLKPVLYTAHMFSFYRRWPLPLRWAAARAESLTCGLADRVICVSRADRDAAAARGIATARFEVVPNGIEAACFRAREHRRDELGFDAGAPVVGMIARLVPQKDPVSFVRMARRVAEHVPAARFLVVGDGPLRGRLEEEGSALIGDRRLVFTGWRRDVPALLATMDVVVFPSLWEAQGIALLEAMASARAVVASRLPSHAEMVADGESGLLVPPGDPELMSVAVADLLGDPVRRTGLGRRAAEMIERRYTIDRMIEETVRVYRSALAGSGR